MLPTKKVGKDWAIYANTGAFIMDRMGERLSASSTNCDFVLVMVLDDVGTKSKVPPLAPTWKMETSKGNYQWGYIFSDQPDTKHFTAAIKAIAEAGYTDGGAINAVRNFRIPGSSTSKGGRESLSRALPSGALIGSSPSSRSARLLVLCRGMLWIPHIRVSRSREITTRF